MMSTAVTAAGLLGISSPALTIGRGAPQAVRLIRSGAAGVSVATWIQAVFLAEVWAAYGFIFHVQAEVVTNIPSGALALLVVILVARRTGSTIRILAFASACSLAAAGLIIASLAYHAPGVVPVVAVAGAIGLYLPQLLKLFRSPEISGVSLASWEIALLGTISWTAYGFVVHKLPVILPNIVMLPSSLAIVWRVGVLRGRDRLGAASRYASQLVP